ncbi:8-amino-7-oxononanoate synthase [Desulfovibrio ferrophilus]|uniref:8-amino-7-oxononanoate synthase n=1 Tax=Desulfovibrio ferrophilus TaxID=241368 RepID=A0A2Z6AXX7_9BACT|nr:8-amino-7-oxononanoate synthase [Desulfovibrio ferrophilus]
MDRGADLYIEYDGRRLLNLASNNYLGLAGASELRDGAIQAVQKYGASSGASRLVTGNFALYDQLDRAVAEFKEQDDAVCVGSGYAANLCVLTSLADRNTVVFSDRLNHASIVDGILLSRATHVRYRHNDLEHLAGLMDRYVDAPRKLVVTDTVFSMDGDVAHLHELVPLCRDYGALLVLDEAHATGVMGRGRGLAHELGVQDEVDVHMGTFSKALGSYGAFIAGRRDIVDAVRNFGRAFIFSTSLPPAAVGAGLAALELVRSNQDRSERLMLLSSQLRAVLRRLGFDFGPSTTQIIPIMLGANDVALAARDFLMDHGVFAPAIRPPTVPEGTSRLRLSLRADLGGKDMDLLCAGLEALAGESGR